MTERKDKKRRKKEDYGERKGRREKRQTGSPKDFHKQPPLPIADGF